MKKLAAFALLVALAGCSKTPEPIVAEPPKQAYSPEETAIRAAVDEHFAKQKAGQKMGGLIYNFHACRGHEILRVEYRVANDEFRRAGSNDILDTVKADAKGYATVRVECSDKNGHPIIRDAKVYLYRTTDGVWSVYQ